MRLMISTLVAVSVAVAGCYGGGYDYVAHPGAPRLRPKPSSCPLHVVASWPYPGYVQIGFVEWNGAAGVPRTLEEFYSSVQPAACEAGADVVIGLAAPDGKYTRGVVLVPAGR